MAPNSFEAEDRKRSIGRDLPSTSRYVQVPPSQQPPDFLTDSLNTSSIPTPSPTKQNTRPGIRARPRRVLGTPRSLAASFKASSENNAEYRPPSSASSSDHQPTQSAANSRVAQINARGYIISPGKPGEKATRSRTKTPSPARGRQISVVSPSSSASSPPRGLAEAYQRINDEELLAQEDSVDNEMSNDIYGYPIPETSQEADEVRLQRMHNSASPISLRASRRASPRGRGEIPTPSGDEAKEKEDHANESDSESILSNLDNLTGHSGSSSQYTKDLQRVNGVLNNDAQAFRKARLGNRVGLTVENLKRRNESSESSSTAPGGGSISSKGSEPSANIPREWGRKARPGKDWLNRINGKSGKFTGDVSKEQKIPSSRHTNQNTVEAVHPKDGPAELLDEWIKTGAEEPHETDGDRSANQNASSRNSTPSATKRDMSLERVADWEINDDDFTGRSLQISDSPPIRVRNNNVDRILEQEIDSLAKRAVTTNRLGELREKTSRESLKRRLHSRSTEDLSQQEIEKNREIPRQRRSSVKFPLQPIVEGESNLSNTIVADKGDPIPDSPIIVFRSSSDLTSTGVESDSTVEDQSRGSSRRPSHDRQDSRDLLRKLSKATSESPTPTKEEQSKENVNDKAIRINIQSNFMSSKLTEENKKFEHSVDGEGKFGGDPSSDDDALRKAVQQTPQQSRSNSSLKTPLVTGAWIDTPLPTGGNGIPLPTPADLEDENEFSSDTAKESRKVAATDLIRKLNPNILSARPKLKNQEPLKYTGPLIPKSALESIISAAKSNSKSQLPKSNSPATANSDSEEDSPLYLGESTIQSLEEILEDTDYSNLLAPSPPLSTPATPVHQEPNITKPLTSAEKSRLSDIQSYARQISRLGNVGPSIRDAKRRLASLERALSTTNTTSVSKSLATQGECDEAGEFHDFIWPCERCGCPARRDLAFAQNATSNLTTISISVPSLWRWGNDDRRPRLTWLGVVTLVWLVWWIADQIAW